MSRAKELRKYAERVISLGKRAPSANVIDGLSGDALNEAKAARVHALRQVRLWVNDTSAIERVFGEYADRYATRPGGYTRVIKISRRSGDNAAMAIIELVTDEMKSSAEAKAVDASADEAEALPVEEETAPEPAIEASSSEEASEDEGDAAADEEEAPSDDAEDSD